MVALVVMVIEVPPRAHSPQSLLPQRGSVCQHRHPSCRHPAVLADGDVVCHSSSLLQLQTPDKCRAVPMSQALLLTVAVLVAKRVPVAVMVAVAVLLPVAVMVAVVRSLYHVLSHDRRR